MRRVLVTGGSGFIGTNLVAYLIDKNYEVLNLDIEIPLDNQQVKYFIKADIRDRSNLIKSFEDFKPDYLIHLAAKADLLGDDLDYYDANITGVQNVIDSVNHIGTVKKCIFTSTMLVCEAGYKPKNEKDYCPPNLYGISKVETEKKVWENKIKSKWVIIRPTSIWGPWIVNTSYRPFFEMIMNGRYFNIPSKRSSTKTYGFVLNSVSQIYKLMTNDLDKKVFYIGDKPPLNVTNWANQISTRAKSRKPLVIPFFLLQVLAKMGDILKKFKISFPLNSFRLMNMTTDNIHDLDELYDVVGESQYDVKSGIDLTLQWFKEYFKK